MARLEARDGMLVLHLSAAEKAESLHRDLRASLSAVRQVEVIDDALEATQVETGFKVGLRVPGKAAVAVVRGGGRKMFVAVHGDTPRAVRVVLDGEPFDEWIVGVTDPESVIADLGLPGPGLAGPG